ncbi:hypothetical protein TWF481_001174 [Arthrobotrys musiformis]|uniref:Uncharacterized protein n=1 Tax=Arthrobotrys musiformis TaxID=47236 RepID=A0AAV9WQM7_9PEZI
MDSHNGSGELVEQYLWIRYIPSKRWLEDEIRNIFPNQDFIVKEALTDDYYDRWVLHIPRLLTSGEIHAIQKNVDKALS